MSRFMARFGEQIELLFLLITAWAGGEGEFGEQDDVLIVPMTAVGNGSLSMLSVLFEEFNGLVVLGRLIAIGYD